MTIWDEVYNKIALSRPISDYEEDFNRIERHLPDVRAVIGKDQYLKKVQEYGLKGPIVTLLYEHRIKDYIDRNRLGKLIKYTTKAGKNVEFRRRSWDKDEVEFLRKQIAAGTGTKDIATQFPYGRTFGSIADKIKKMKRGSQ